MGTLDTEMGKYGRRLTSQNDEDGILAYLFGKIRGGSFVEIGVGPGAEALEGNCVALERRGWHGMLIDQAGGPGVVVARVTAMNVNGLLGRNASPDLLSIDVDGQDFWIWMNVQCRPAVVVIEYNASLGPTAALVMKFDAEHRWDGTSYFGASLRALEHLGRSKGYTLVYANGVNAFFVRDDHVENRADFEAAFLYRPGPRHPPDQQDRPWVRIPDPRG
jgi:hypothetical protein